MVKVEEGSGGRRRQQRPGEVQGMGWAARVAGSVALQAEQHAKGKADSGGSSGSGKGWVGVVGNCQGWRLLQL